MPASGSKTGMYSSRLLKKDCENQLRQGERSRTLLCASYFALRLRSGRRPSIKKRAGIAAENIATGNALSDTPGTDCFDLGEGRARVGDAEAVGRPGATSSPDAFALTLRTMQAVFFT